MMRHSSPHWPMPLLTNPRKRSSWAHAILISYIDQLAVFLSMLNRRDLNPCFQDKGLSYNAIYHIGRLTLTAKADRLLTSFVLITFFIYIFEGERC